MSAINLLPKKRGWIKKFIYFNVLNIAEGMNAINIKTKNNMYVYASVILITNEI